VCWILGEILRGYKKKLPDEIISSGSKNKLTDRMKYKKHKSNSSLYLRMTIIS
jgi:hypothetical protein